MVFAQFMSSRVGRVVRMVAGAALFVIGVSIGGGWLVVAALGLVPLVAAALDVCLFAPLFGQSLSGKSVRGQR